MKDFLHRITSGWVLSHYKHHGITIRLDQAKWVGPALFPPLEKIDNSLKNLGALQLNILEGFILKNTLAWSNGVVIDFTVCWVQAMAQVGGLVMLQPEVGGSRENFFFAGIDKVRFRKPVIAGDTLVMRMTLIKLQKRFGIAKMEGKAYVGGEVVCEGEFLMATGS